MTKNYFDPASVWFKNIETGKLSKSALPRMTSRRFPGADRFGSSAYKTDGGDGGEDKRTEDELLQIIQTRIDTAVQKDLATRATKEEVETFKKEQLELFKGIPLDALRSMADDKTGVMSILTKQGMEITRLQNQAKDQIKAMDVRSQVAAWMETNKAKIQAIREGGRAESLPALEIRVAANPMTVGSVNSGNSIFIGRVEGEATPTDFVRAQPVFWDFVTKGRTSAPTYYWVNKTNPQGAAAFISPGVYKPNVSFSLVSETSNAKKIADSAKATMELLEDIDGMTTFIEQELKYQVFIKLNATLMTGVSSSTVPAGIQTLSVPYSISKDVLSTPNPNYMDCIRAVVAQLRSGWLMGDITVFINSLDAAQMDLSKANDSGIYLLPPFVTANGRSIGGATVIEDNNVPVGHIQAAFMRYYRILIYRDFTVSWGWENDDFTKNLITAIGEMRLHQFFNSQYTGAFVYDTFAAITALLTPAP